MANRTILKGLGALLAVGAALGLVGKADAGIIKIANATNTSGVGTSILTAENISGASEGLDAVDSSFQPPLQTNALEIYTKVNGNLFMLDARPIETTGWDFDLAVKGNVNGIDNYLRYKITDTTDLIGKTITMYDKANPSTVYTLLMDNAYHNISLPTLTSGQGEYAHWGVRITPEPATLGLMAAGAAAAGLSSLRRDIAERKRRKAERIR